MDQQQNTALPWAHQKHYLSDEQLAYLQRLLTDSRQGLQAEYSEAHQRIRHQDERGGDIVDQSIKDSAAIST